MPYMNDMHKANPLVYFQRYDYCPDSVINARIGITQGFYAYEWQKDGVTIATGVNGVNTIIDGTSIIQFTGNEVRVNAFGTYRVRFMRTATSGWSAWSMKPAVIYSKPFTVTPPITVDGVHSKVLPALDQSTSVPLKIPAGYFGYQWVRVGDGAIVSTQNTYTAPLGQYRAKIIEQFGCGSSFSPIFTVVNASGSPKPDAAKNLSAIATSVSGIQLDWNQNPNAGQNETGFEIYRGTSSGGPYQLLAITAPDVITYLDQALQGNTQYYYVVRAVSDFGAAANSNEAEAAAQQDITPPTLPANLTVSCSSRTFVFLKWNASTDNLAVAKYDIYVNGIKTYSTTNTSFEVHQLTPRQTYAFSVVARDAAGNSSQPSAQVNANTVLQGVCYKFFNNEVGLTELPNFSNQIPVTTGNATSVALTAGGVDNFGYLYEGYINIATADNNIRFRTCSDDGSKLYFNAPYNHTALETVNNDGLHGDACVSTGDLNLAAGFYPFAVSFFENGGGEAIRLEISTNGGTSWATVNTGSGWLTETAYTPGGTAPTAPSQVAVVATAFNKATITWNDNSTGELGFEVVRATSVNGTFVPAGTTSANATSFSDSGLIANTTYYYKVRSIGTFGASAFTATESNWQLNNNYTDALLSPTKILSGGGGAAEPTFNAADKVQGSHSLSFDGTSDFVLFNSSSSGGFPSDGVFTRRTVSLWVKPTVTTGKRMLVELGGLDNGLAIRFNTNNLEAGVASGSVRSTISLSNFASNINWLAGGWNHIALVYSTNTLRLYLNGIQVASNTSLAFSSIAANSSSTSRLGLPSGENAFNDGQATYTSYSGLMDHVEILVNEAATLAEVTALKNLVHGQSMDTTFVAPAIPSSPTNLITEVASKDNINLTWNDNSSNETHFEVWRSVGNQSNWRLIKTVAGDNNPTKSYSDLALFANITYYYMIKAVGVGGTSGTTNVAFATTLNTAPDLTHILDFTMKHTTEFSLPINAIDEDGDPITFTFEYLPYFVNIENVSNGNINVVLNPTIGDQGSYTITVFADDGHNGFDTAYFSMVVNDNTVPVLNNILDKVVDEGKTLVIPLSANDAEGNSYMAWSFQDKPSFATFVDSGNGKGSLTLKPGYAASGIYTMTVYADDGGGAWDSRTFQITVNEVDPNESIKVNMKYYTQNVATWNEVNLPNLTPPFNRTALVTSKGVVTTVGINALTSNYNGAEFGVQTGNNSGVYPDNVMRDYLEWGIWNTGVADTLRLRVFGLDTARRYNFVFFASSTNNFYAATPNAVTTYRIGNDVATVPFYLNASITDTIYQIKPNAAGEVIITMVGNAATQAGGMLNALVIDAAYDDGTVPTKPLDLNAAFTENSGVRLNWVDRAYNEYAYNVYRATSKTGPYTLLNAGQSSKDSTTYNDATAQQFTQYFYYVVGSNNHGEGGTSDTVSITTGNNKPIINDLANFRVKTDASFQEDFSVSDVVTDVVTVTIPGMPSFVTLTSLGGGNYRIVATPTIDNFGQHFLTVVASDDKGGVTTKELVITVADKNTTSVYVNFGEFLKIAPAPWNNFLHYGNAGQVFNNLLDENSTPSGMSMQFVDGWSSMFQAGHKTGNNSGAVPDSVLAGGIFYTGTNTRSITISGLTGNANTRYNIVVIGSRNEGLDAQMRVTSNVGGVDTLNARNNTNMTANLNGLTASGNAITVIFNKIGSGVAMYLNGIIIEKYESIPLMNPVNLYVEPKDRTTTVLSWSDRSSTENAADGFQLQRATDSLFTQGVTNIAIGGNNSTYTNTGLTANTKYWYRIRAKNGTAPGTFSDWSNRVKTITPESIVFINFNQNVQSAGSPWNNLESFPAPGVNYPNLKNQSNINTGYKLTITKTFNGENNAGMSTGNNSGMGGLVPDLVMQSGYWMDNLQQSQVVISGLNKNKRYRVGFISSSNWIGGDLTATMTINGRTVYINSWQNTTKIVYIGDLLANDNSELEINISTTQPSANAYSSGFIIEAYDDVNGGAVLNSANPNPNGQQRNVVAEVGPTDPQLLTERANQVAVSTYPNPFVDIVNLDFTNTSSANAIGVDVYDVNGRMVMSRDYGKLSEGPQTLRINTKEGELSTGIYLVTLTINGKPAAVTKLIKTKQ